MCFPQTLTEAEYGDWLEGRLQAETAIQGREELLFQSAIKLETNLHLLGKRNPYLIGPLGLLIPFLLTHTVYQYTENLQGWEGRAV